MVVPSRSHLPCSWSDWPPEHPPRASVSKTRTAVNSRRRPFPLRSVSAEAGPGLYSLNVFRCMSFTYHSGLRFSFRKGAMGGYLRTRPLSEGGLVKPSSKGRGQRHWNCCTPFQRFLSGKTWVTLRSFVSSGSPAPYPQRRSPPAAWPTKSAGCGRRSGEAGRA